MNMPELPEVETIRRDLERVVVGRIIESVEVRVRKLFQGDKKSLIGKKLEKVERLGKMLTLYFSDKRAGEHTFQNQNNFFPAKKFSFTSPHGPATAGTKPVWGCGIFFKTYLRVVFSNNLTEYLIAPQRLCPGYGSRLPRRW